MVFSMIVSPTSPPKDNPLPNPPPGGEWTNEKGFKTLTMKRDKA